MAIGGGGLWGHFLKIGLCHRLGTIKLHLRAKNHKNNRTDGHTNRGQIIDLFLYQKIGQKSIQGYIKKKQYTSLVDNKRMCFCSIDNLLPRERVPVKLKHMRLLSTKELYYLFNKTWRLSDENIIFE